MNRIVHAALGCQDVCLHTINKPPNMKIQLKFTAKPCPKKTVDLGNTVINPR